MLVQIICVPANGGFLTLVWPGLPEETPVEGQIRIYHSNIMDLLDNKQLEDPECLKVSGGVTYWQARWRGELAAPAAIVP